MSEDTPVAGDELPYELGFASWRSYWDFAREVTHNRRYHLSEPSRRFLSELLRTSEQRQSRLRAGHRLCRAQVAHSEYDDPDAGPLPRPAMPDRMVPLAYAASDGRANPRGIPCLYMADDRHTAIAEVRPWIGSLVSVAIMRTRRDQCIVDVRDDTARTPIYLDGEPPPTEREASVWCHVARAFREPVLREDNRAGYAATQIIAEAFRDHGYDGIAYGSGFGKGRTNIVLFDIAAAELEVRELHEIKNVQLIHDEIESPYFVRKDADGGASLLRNVITAIGSVGGPLLPLNQNDPDGAAGS